MHYLKLCVVLSIILLAACSRHDTMTFDQEIKNVLEQTKLEFKKIIHYEVVSEGLYVFLENKEGSVSSGLIEIKNGEYKWKEGIGSVDIVNPPGSNEPFSLIVTGQRNSEPRYIAYGVITDEKVRGIKHKDISAKIITLPELSLWIIFSDKKLDMINLVATY